MTSPGPSKLKIPQGGRGVFRQWEKHGRWIKETVVFDVLGIRDAFIITANGIPLPRRD